MADDRILRILLQYSNDPAALSGASTGAKQLETGLKSVQAQAASTTAELRSLRMVARELNQVGTITLAAGTALAAPFIAAAAKYVSATGQMDQVSSHWLLAMDKVNRSTESIGRVAAGVLLPGLQQAANVSEKIAGFLEKNPGVVDAALKIGATAIVVGTVEKAVAEGIRMYADVKLIAAAGLQDTAADKMLAAAQIQAGAATASGAGAAAGAAGGGANLGTWLNRGLVAGGTVIGQTAINSAWNAGAAAVFSRFEQLTGTNPNTGGVYGALKNYQTTQGPAGLGQITTLISGIGQLVGLLSNRVGGGASAYGPPLPSNYYATSALYQGLDASDRAAHRNDPGTPIFTPPPTRMEAAQAAALPAYQAYNKASAANYDAFQTQDSSLRMNFLKSALQAEASYNGNRLIQIRDFGEQSTQLEKSYNDNRRIQIRDFNEQSAQLEKSYNQSRLLAIRNFNEQQAQADENFNESQTKAVDAHNTEMARLAQDHALQLQQMADTHSQTSRDLAAKGDALGFVKEQQNYAKQVADTNAKYQLEVTRKNQDFAKSQADAKANYEEQRKLALDAFAQSQADAAKAYQDQKDQRATQFAQQLDDAARAYQDQKDQRAFRFQQQLTDAQNAFDDQQRQAKDNFRQALTDNQKHYDDQQAQLTKAFNDQLDAIDPILRGWKTNVQTNMQAASDEFAKFLVGVQSQINGGPGYCGPGYHWDAQTKSCVPDTPTHWGSAAGGYAGYGLRLLGEGTGSLAGPEYVLNALTTRGLESALGGPLTQQGVLNALTRRGGVSVELGGIYVSGGGATLAGVLDAVDARITESWNSFADALGSH